MFSKEHMHMKIKRSLVLLIGILFTSAAGAWQANVTNILQHGTYVAVYLSPDPGPGTCQYGSPYLLVVDNTPESKQRFAMIMMALATGKKIGGYDDPCDTAIWAQSRPTIQRLHLLAD